MVENQSKTFTALNSSSAKGSFERKESEFRNFISKTSEQYPVEAGRYHLYISWACPWANRCAAVRQMKGLTDAIGLTVVHPIWKRTRPEEDEHAGWWFSEPNEVFTTQNGYGAFSYPDTSKDPHSDCQNVRQLYEKYNAQRPPFSVPILFDSKTKTIVNNESSEIIVMLNNEFNDIAKNPDLNLLPSELKAAMDEADEWIYIGINNGVYRNGFAKTQEAYEAANKLLFESLDRLDGILAKQKFIAGDVFTMTDLRCWQTIVRFDEVYVVYFKTDKKRITDYEHIFRWCKDVWAVPGIKETTHMDHIKQHYFASHPILNHYGIVPTGDNFLGKLE